MIGNKKIAQQQQKKSLHTETHSNHLCYFFLSTTLKVEQRPHFLKNKQTKFFPLNIVDPFLIETDLPAAEGARDKKNRTTKKKRASACSIGLQIGDVHSKNVCLLLLVDPSIQLRKSSS